MLSCGKLGPKATIAKVKVERKEKSQKRPGKCNFFMRHVEITAKTAGYSELRGEKPGWRGAVAGNFLFKNRAKGQIAA
jgi:hypothetical protein